MDLTFSPVLAALDEEWHDTIAARSVRRSLRRGQPLHIAGDLPDRVHVVVHGVVKLTATDADGRDTIFGLAHTGDLVGDGAALEGRPHALDALAAVRTDVIGFDATLFLKAVSACPGASLAIARHAAARHRWLSTVMLERATAEVPARLAGRLLDLAGTLGKIDGGSIELELPLFQEDLGRLSGMCRESASKTLARLRRQGVIDYKGRRLRIHRPDVLERIRCAGRA